MISFTLKGLLGRKLRTALTAFAIVLGVAMVSGTFVLTDSIDKAFDSIFTSSRQGSTAVVSGKSAFDLSDGSGASAPAFDQSVLETVRGVAGVAAAEGSVHSESAQLIDQAGKAITFGGAPNLGFSIADGDSPFNPLVLVEGNWPGANEVVIDKSTAAKKDLAVGDTIGVQAEGPVQRLTISGIVTFGSTGLTIGGATLAGFDLPTAQRLFDKQRKLDEIAIAASAGTPDAQLVKDVSAVLPKGTAVRLASEQVAKDAADTNEFIIFLQGFLLAFAGIALFVGSFVIANSLSITIAQRTREFATIRTLGGSRRQVLWSIVLEALVVGFLASAIGLVAGLGLAKGLFRLFDAVGFTLPNSGLLFEARTIVVSLLVGVVVTLLASLRPAIRATRVPPIAAVREGGTLPESRFARFRTAGSLATIMLGFAALAYGLFGSGLGTTQLLLWMGVGALLIFMGVALFSARIARPLAGLVSPVGTWAVVLFSALVWPLFTLPFWLVRCAVFGPGAAARRVLFGVLGTVLNPFIALIVFLMWIGHVVRGWEPEWPLDFPGILPDRTMNRVARDNARRNPQRTASTAAALMIGLALVTLVAVLAKGITATFEGAVNDLFTGDYAITAQNNFSPIPTTAADAAAKASGVLAVASTRTGEGRVFGKTEFVTAVDDQAAKVLSLDWVDGSQAILGSLGDDGAFVDEPYAKDNKLVIGSPIEVQTPRGRVLHLTLRGTFDPPAGGSPFGSVTFSAALFDRSYDAPKNLYSFVLMRGGVTPGNTRALDAALVDFPNAKAATQEQFVKNQISGLSSILNILYVLLALSVVVSLFGIVNTLVLTVFERTREIGMLRAIGMTRHQTRRVIRHESVITALIGGVLGIVLGLVLGGLLVARVDFIEFALPVAQIVVFAVATVVVGIVAAIFPARRAAHLDPLEALQYE